MSSPCLSRRRTSSAAAASVRATRAGGAPTARDERTSSDMKNPLASVTVSDVQVTQVTCTSDTSGLEEALLALCVAHQQVLRLLVVVEHHLVVLAPHARAL